MRKFLLAGISVITLGAAVALAQVNVVPQTGVITGIANQKATYRAVALALPPAASATDIACIAGSASKVIKVQEIRISGIAGTLVSAPFTLVRRSGVNTAGTAATT